VPPKNAPMTASGLVLVMMRLVLVVFWTASSVPMKVERPEWRMSMQSGPPL
jgi:hypothetical protein